LNCDIEKLSINFKENRTIIPLSIRKEEKKMTESKEISADRNSIELILPYEGDHELLFVQPST